LTASSLAPLAAPGSDHFIALAIMLALLVGVIQLLLGVFKLGVIVNFLSHPVIVGFTNAAAIIIALSQVSKLFGVPMGRSEHFINDIWGVFKQIGDTHLPTLAMGALAIAIMWASRNTPKLPGVLIAVVVTTLLSWAIGFERNADGKLEQIADPELMAVVQQGMTAAQRVADLNAQISAKSAELKAIEKPKANPVSASSAPRPRWRCCASGWPTQKACTPAKRLRCGNCGWCAASMRTAQRWRFIRQTMRRRA
jgi:sulfate permease, SulP family